MNKLDTILAEDIENEKIDELLEINDILCEGEINVKNLDSQIENLISHSKEYEKDFSTSDKHKEQIISAKCKIKIRLNKVANVTCNSHIPHSSNSNSSVSE